MNQPSQRFLVSDTLPADDSATDRHLWLRAVDGDRAAFGEIVHRYQGLVCSLALSASGNLARSEDLAQETFITAWQQLGDLREPEKLRAWLCGIVRNLAANAARREQRRTELLQAHSAAEGTLDPLHGADTAGVDPSTRGQADDPLEQAISDEEARLLWRTLGQVPVTYREPLVLFYRQGQSIAAVAAALELSEDAVKQRLARGRALLHDEVARVVERTLSHSAPGAAFMLSVLAALPALTPPGANAAVLTAVATGQGATGVKAAVAGLSKWAFIGPAIGLAIGLASTHAAASTGRSPEERALIRRHAWRMVIFCWVMSIGLAAVLSQADTLYSTSAGGIVGGVLLWVLALVGTILWASKRMEREVARIRITTGTDDDTPGVASYRYPGPIRYCSRATFLGLPLIDVAIASTIIFAPSLRARGWLAVGDVAVSPLFAFGGLAAAPVAVGGITFGILSLSLWGLAAGVLAFGSVAAGYWTYGFGALGWQGAAGAAAVARDYAIGSIVSATEANTPVAQDWFTQQWFHAPIALWGVASVGLILLLVVLALGRVIVDARRQRQNESDVADQKEEQQ